MILYVPEPVWIHVAAGYQPPPDVRLVARLLAELGVPERDAARAEG